MGRWKAVTLANSFGANARVESNEPKPFSVGGDRIVPAGIKVWPVKGKAFGRLWSGKPVIMQRDFMAGNFHSIPDNPKFSRFIELNKVGKQFYLITMFQAPKRDPADPEGVTTFGFVVDLNRTTLK